MALYPYSASNEDELSFEKDDVIILLAREEDAWWRGELKGVSGLFPSNYVAPICEYTHFIYSIRIAIYCYKAVYS